MAVNFITYNSKRQKVAHPVTSREEYLALRDTEQNRNADKRHLLQMNYSLAGEGEFLLRGASTVGNSVGMDIDHVVDIDALAETILGKKDEIGLLMLEKSYSGEGLHLVFKRHPEMSNEENLQWASSVLGVEFDKGAKDVTRVFYTPTSDKMLYLDDELFINDVNENLQKTIQTPNQCDDTVSQETQNSCNSVNSCKTEKEYLGISYEDIIDKYWELFYGGKTPVKSNRDTLTYELANVLKHICGFDRQLLAEVIPCYDGFPEVEKMKCIDSALSGKRTQMPKRLRDVLEALHREQLISGENTTTGIFEDALTQDELFYYNRMPRSVMVKGVKDSIDAAGHTLAMPIITAICPAIGARATGVMLVVHKKVNSLNLISYIAGDFASGKGQVDDIVKAWLSEDIEMAKMYNQQWEEWRDKYKASRNKKELPVEPRLPKVWITLNNTTANLAESLSNVQGRHAFSFTPEADVVSQKWKSSVSDFSTMLRQAYDASSYDREARSVDAVNVHIERLLWNVVMCGTPDALYRVVDNYTDGFQSRIAVARTPDNTYAPLDDDPATLTDLQKEHIMQVSHLLPLLNGTVVLPKLEKRGRKWLEEIRIETMKNDDRVMARQRFRICVTAQRMTCCLMLAAVCSKLIDKHGVTGAEKRLKQDPNLWVSMTENMQTESFLEVFDIIADSLIENAMYFFRERIEAAFRSNSYSRNNATPSNRTRKGKNDSIFSRLCEEFSFGEAQAFSVSIKGANVTQNATQQMLKNWQKQGLVVLLDNGNYRKISR